MGICSCKLSNNAPKIAVKAVNPVGSSNGGSGGSNSSTKGHCVADQKVKSSPPPKTGCTNASSAAEAHKKSPEAAVVGKIITPNLKMFTYIELRSATRNFRPDTVLGEGGFGTVFKGWVDKKTYAPSRPGIGIPVAVKKSSPDSDQGFKEWQAEVDFLGKISHPNLVKLLGYCWEDKEFLLVYEYMQKGSLETHLFRKGADTIPWETRLKIAIDAARGLAFLHNTEKQVIYRDFKAANILLDGDFNAKLSDFGLAKSGPLDGDSHVTTQVLGTYGYAAPEYLATGHLYVKSDVFGFGVVLLELLMGLRVVDLNRPSEEHNLVEWARPMIPDKRKLRKLMDPRLEGQYPSRGAFQTAQLVLKCLELDPKNRSSMEEVLLSLELISTIKTKPKETKPDNKHATYHGNLRKYPTAPSTVPSRPRPQQHQRASPSSY